MKLNFKKILFTMIIVSIIFLPTLPGTAESEVLPGYLYKSSESYEIFFPDLNYSQSIPIDSTYYFVGMTLDGQYGVFSKGDEVILYDFFENEVEPNVSHESLYGLHLVSGEYHYLYGVMTSGAFGAIYDKKGNIIVNFQGHGSLWNWHPATGLFYFFKTYRPSENSETKGVQLFSYDLSTGEERVVATIDNMTALDGTVYNVIPDSAYLHPDKDVMIFVARSINHDSASYCSWLISLTGEYAPVILKDASQSEVDPIHWDRDAYSYIQLTHYGVKRSFLDIEEITTGEINSPLYIRPIGWETYLPGLQSPDGKYTPITTNIGELVIIEDSTALEIYLTGPLSNSPMNVDQVDASKMDLKWSFDSQWLSFFDQIESIMKIYEINSGTFVSYTGPNGIWVQAKVGSEFQISTPSPTFESTPNDIPETSPTPSGLENDLSSLIERKETAIELLQTTTYSTGFFSYEEDLVGFDESTAISLIAKITGKLPSEVSIEEIDRFYRLVIQEETIADIFSDYSEINNWYSDSVVDTIGMVHMISSVIQGLASREKGIQKIAGNVRNDTFLLIERLIPDQESRDYLSLAYDFYDIGSPIVDVSLSDPSSFIDLAEQAAGMYVEGELRKVYAQKNIDSFVNRNQYYLNLGVHAADIDNIPLWEIAGTSEVAETRKDFILGITNRERDYALDIHQNSLIDQSFAHILSDISDLSLVSTPNPMSLVASLTFKLANAFINDVDSFRMSYSMYCLKEAASLSGEAVYSLDFDYSTCEQITDTNRTVFGLSLDSSQGMNSMGLLSINTSSQNDIPEQAGDAIVNYYSSLEELEAEIENSEENNLEDVLYDYEQSIIELSATFNMLLEDQDAADKYDTYTDLYFDLLVLQIQGLRVVSGAKWMLDSNSEEALVEFYDAASDSKTYIMENGYEEIISGDTDNINGNLWSTLIIILSIFCGSILIVGVAITIIILIKKTKKA